MRLVLVVVLEGAEGDRYSYSTNRRLTVVEVAGRSTRSAGRCVEYAYEYE